MSSVGTQNPSVAWAVELVAGLSDRGVQDVVISPGSRSTPLVAAAHHAPVVRTHVVVDERSAGFYALGLARATGKPVALVCTSGTAGAHYHPAVCEAHCDGVPLVVVTADRPPELRDSGASQSMNQRGMFAPHVHFELDLPCPDGSERPESARQAARQAARAAAERPGPVHLNVPFRKPLEPTRVPEAPAVESADEPARALESPRVDGFVAKFDAAHRPLFLAGSLSPSDALSEVVALAEHTGTPIVAEATSNLRFGRASAGVVAGDHLVAGLQPDLVIRLGRPPINWPVGQWYDRLPSPIVAVHPLPNIDPGERADEYFQTDLGSWVEAVGRKCSRQAGGPWWDEVVELGAVTRARVDEALGASPLTHARVAWELARALPAGGNLFVASSMSLRELEGFGMPRAGDLHVYANRGLNGIDGLHACALGVARGSQRPTALLLGDVAFAHDVGSLQLLRGMEEDLSVFVVDNGGGQIFGELPIREHAPLFDRYFRTPLDLDIHAVVRGFGVPVEPLDSAEDVREAAAGLAGRGPRVYVVRVDGQEDRRRREEIIARLSR